MINSIAILGAGAVGGFLAAYFSARGKDVVCIVRDAGKYGELKISSLKYGEWTARPKFTQSLETRPDVLFIATKAYDLEKALEKIPPQLVRNTLVVPLLNGLDHIELIKKILQSDKVIAASINIGARREGQNTIVQFSPLVLIRLGADKLHKTEVQDLSKELNDLGIKTEVGDGPAEVLWQKAVLLNAMSLLMAASGETLGEIRAAPALFADLKAAVIEAIAVAGREGIELDFQQIARRLDVLPDEFKTSMARDHEQAHNTELDHIAGAILKRASICQLECPVIEKYYRLLKQS